MQKSWYILAALLCCNLHAQEKAKDSTKLAKDTLQAINNAAGKLIVVQQDSAISDNKPTVVFKKQGVKYNLQDYVYAATLDSLWMKELYNSSLFDTLQNTITKLDYNLVEYNNLPTPLLKQRLEELNQRTPFNIAYNPSLESVIKSFLKNRRKSLERLMTMSQFYFPLFEQELDNYDIPLEIKYLAIVESALNPRARSRVGATGLWQFMFTTGKMYDLDVSSYVDERSDPIAATKAACEYLARLYKIFGDWDLALAAYNSGPGNVTKAIRRSGGYENYWNIRPYLPRETAGYLPAFLATMYIFEYAEEHGFKPKKADIPYFETDTVHIKKTITFDQISELMDIDVEKLQFLNPSYKLDIIPYVKEKQYVLRLPKEQIGRFVAHEDSIYAHVEKELAKREKPLPQLFNQPSRVRYRVRNGDYLGKIANRYGVRVSDIRRWNGMRNNNIRVGQRLTIYPRKAGGAPVPKTKKQTNKTTAAVSGNKIYTVQSGDSLWTIAQKFSGISVQNIKDWNGISGNKLKPGQKLKLCNGC
jgi:membrane-bound lytic murein transglycosylase D